MKTSCKYTRTQGVIKYPQLGGGPMRPYPTQKGEGAAMHPYPTQRGAGGLMHPYPTQRGAGSMHPYPTQPRKQRGGKRRRKSVMRVSRRKRPRLYYQ